MSAVMSRTGESGSTTLGLSMVSGLMSDVETGPRVDRARDASLGSCSGLAAAWRRWIGQQMVEKFHRCAFLATFFRAHRTVGQPTAAARPLHAAAMPLSRGCHDRWYGRAAVLGNGRQGAM